DAQAKEAADEASSETEDEDESPLTADEPADEETADDTQEEDTASSGPLKVVWLGDSLTQGSLGDDNGNVDNPQAPWRVLKGLSGYDVEGFGYYGYYTHDILWKWGEDGGKKDPGTVYVFWCGSCDFRESQNETATVIKEIDTFLKNGKLDKYIVMGTTPRSELGVEGAKNVNGKLEDKYGDKYLDILEYVEFGPDKLHLTEASYHKIAEVVYDKIKELYE
nr:SGNH/GDSL hydrolase family protein [Lachnospiraceae bacterium]